MTVFLRALYGPFGAFDENTHIDWFFFGIREDNTMGRWAVRFTILPRTWQTVNFPSDTPVKIGRQWLSAGPAVEKDAYVPNRPMVRGRTYLDILKPRLSNDDIAFASRAAIAAAGGR